MSDRVTRILHPNPIDPCIRCFQPEAKRGFLIEGDAEFTAAAFVEFADMPMDEALGMVKMQYDKSGTPYDQVVRTQVRMCRACGNKTGAPLYSWEALNEVGRELRGIVQG